MALVNRFMDISTRTIHVKRRGLSARLFSQVKFTRFLRVENKSKSPLLIVMLYATLCAKDQNRVQRYNKKMRCANIFNEKSVRACVCQKKLVILQAERWGVGPE